MLFDSVCVCCIHNWGYTFFDHRSMETDCCPLNEMFTSLFPITTQLSQIYRFLSILASCFCLAFVSVPWGIIILKLFKQSFSTMSKDHTGTRKCPPVVAQRAKSQNRLLSAIWNEMWIRNACHWSLFRDSVGLRLHGCPGCRWNAPERKWAVFACMHTVVTSHDSEAKCYCIVFKCGLAARSGQV